MWVAVGCYALIFLAVVACVVSATHAERERVGRETPAAPDSAALIPQEWELVQRRHCAPTHCPRAVGLPLGPRKDASCVACATAFLEQRWDSLLRDAERAPGSPGDSGPAPRELQAAEVTTLAPPVVGPAPARPPLRSGSLWAKLHPSLGRWQTGAGGFLIAGGVFLLLSVGIPWTLALGCGIVLAAGGGLIAAAVPGRN